MSQVVLAIDTALSACSVAITRGDTTLACRVEPMARGQAERLAPLVEQMMTEAGVSFQQLDVIAVTRGPGAFTGLRVGLAFARGLALALGKPCVGVSTLEVLAAGAGQFHSLAVISVAGSNFVGAWNGQNIVVAPCRADLDTIMEDLTGDWTITGPGTTLIEAMRPSWPTIPQSVPNPIVLARIAQYADPAVYPPVPLYLRGVEAKLSGGVLLPENTP